jgi:predicted transcriptional regulator
MVFVNLVFRSKKKGLNRLFGEIESEIMKLLWEKGPLKGKDVHEALRKKKKTALTTILTVLERLSEKGLVRKDRDAGRTIYSALVSRQKFEAGATSELIRGAYDLSPDFAISAFSDIFSKMKSDELDRLARLIEEKRNENRKDD